MVVAVDNFQPSRARARLSGGKSVENVAFLKSIPGHTGYMVSSHGHVVGPRGVMRQEIDKDGYRRVSVYLGRGLGYRRWLVHRAVYAAFIGDLDPGLVVCHRDGSRDNNRVDNLEQKTQRENIADKLVHGTHQVGDRHGMTVYPDSLAIAVKEFIESNPRTRGYLSRAAEFFCVPKHFVFDVVRGRRVLQ